jgi:hypothetical protein
MKTLMVALWLAVTALSAAAEYPPENPPPEWKLVSAPQAGTQAPTQINRIIKISVVGYGAASSYEKYNEGQKKLMAMRASKLDAYRAIAEQVYGVRLAGGSTVGATVASNDNFRVTVDAYVRGARVANVMQAADGTFETTMEMDFDESVVRGLLAQAPARTVTVPANNSGIVNRAFVGPGALYGASYYYAE